jgi:hypothetical protein
VGATDSFDVTVAATAVGVAGMIASPPNGLAVPDVVLGVQLPPPVLLSQMWKLPVDERSLVLVVVGVKSQLAALITGDLLPTVREPRVTVSIVLLLLHT